MKTDGQFRTCRCCNERTYDYDAELGEWWCDSCDAPADV